MKKKVVLAITGASGSIYAERLIERLSSEELINQYNEIALVFSDTAKQIWNSETGNLNLSDFKFPVFSNKNFDVPFASGSGVYDTMIICPCSMGTLGRITAGISNDLITRAADVVLKERKRLILCPRETPFGLIHLNNMKALTEAGAVICPAIPSFYHNPQTIEELADTVVDRILDLAGFDIKTKRWKMSRL